MFSRDLEKAAESHLKPLFLGGSIIPLEEMEAFFL